MAKRFANIGYGIYATKGTTDLFEAEGLYVHGASKIETEDGKNVLDIIRNGRVNFVINTMSNKKNTSADGDVYKRQDLLPFTTFLGSLNCSMGFLQRIMPRAFLNKSRNGLFFLR